jgi:hypothetical protein
VQSLFTTSSKDDEEETEEVGFYDNGEDMRDFEHPREEGCAGHPTPKFDIGLGWR